jgi:hypothetical protein
MCAARYQWLGIVCAAGIAAILGEMSFRRFGR